MKESQVILRVTTIREFKNNVYVVVLSNIQNTLYLPIIIGIAEARVIAFSLEGLKGTRPFTHDLMTTILNNFDITLEKVSLVKLEKGIFYAEITLKKGDKTITIDARPSDAISMALRFNHSIFCNQSILDEAGLKTPFRAEGTEQDLENQREITMNELKVKMQDAVEEENYELAAEIKMQIEQMKKEDNQNEVS